MGKLHDNFIVHRDLRCDTVGVKVKKGRVKIQIGCFDLAYCLKKGHMVTQTFNVSRRFAPEIEQAQAHDTAADIWSLGQVCYQLLCCISQDQIIRLSAEAEGL